MGDSGHVIDIILASGNAHKRREFDELAALHGAGRIRLVAPAHPVLGIEETGSSYTENACIKAHAYVSEYTTPALGDDSGLAVDTLGGAPGLRSARFGGPGLDDAGRVTLLLDRLRDVPEDRRGAHFVCVLCVIWPDGRRVTARGMVQGRIARRPSGAHGFGYDPIFVLPSLGRTMAELTAEEKHRLSHRGRAFRRLVTRL